MRPRLDLVLPAALVACAGIELAPLDARPVHACLPAVEAGPERAAAEQRTLAEGYSEISRLRKGCDNAWHALALAEGDPVNVVVTAHGSVLTE